MIRLDPVTLFQIEREKRQEPKDAPSITINGARRAYFRRYYVANRERKNAASKANHQRRGIEHSRAYRAANRERINASGLASYHRRKHAGDNVRHGIHLHADTRFFDTAQAELPILSATPNEAA